MLVLLPIPGKPLQARYFGPYVVEKKISDPKYVVETPDSYKINPLCHVSMLKPYYDRNGTQNDVKSIASVNVNANVNACNDPDNETELLLDSAKLNNSDIIQNLDKKLKHLPSA